MTSTTPSTDVALRPPGGSSLVTFSDEQVDTLRHTLCKDLSNSELDLFLAMCQKYALDPFSRQIYATKTGGKLTPITSIDGFRLIAQRSGQYAGQRAPQWTADGETWTDVWLSPTPPAAARVTILRHDWVEPMVVTLSWQEYTGGSPSPMQRKMPAHMLAKATEALGLRKAHPNDLSGLYTSDEIPPDVVVPAGSIEVIPNGAPAPAKVRRRPDAKASDAPEVIVSAERHAEIRELVAQLDETQRPEVAVFAKGIGAKWTPDAMTVEHADLIETFVRTNYLADEEVDDVELIEPDPTDSTPVNDGSDDALADITAAVEQAQTTPATSSRRKGAA